MAGFPYTELNSCLLDAAGVDTQTPLTQIGTTVPPLHPSDTSPVYGGKMQNGQNAVVVADGANGFDVITKDRDVVVMSTADSLGVYVSSASSGDSASIDTDLSTGKSDFLKTADVELNEVAANVHSVATHCARFTP